MITLAAECTARFSALSLVDRIWSGAEWHAARSGIQGVAIANDDGQSQSVHLCVDWQRRGLALTLERRRENASRISFFYSRPPLGVLRETGGWEARGPGDECRLSLIRRLELHRGKDESSDSLRRREQAYGELLQAHLGRSLEALCDRGL
nr:hypothetical protein [uncultured Rhodopila sp.]